MPPTGWSSGCWRPGEGPLALCLHGFPGGRAVPARLGAHRGPDDACYGLGFLDRLWQDWSPGYDAAEDLARAKESLRQPANLTAAISYYRDPVPGAVVPYAAEEQAASRQAQQPTLYLHGSVDGCIAVELVRGAERHLASGSRMLVVDGAGHFPHLEGPEEVSEQILAWATG